MSIRPLRGLTEAFGFLTVIPIGREWGDGPSMDAVGWYPFVGWVVGAVGVSMAFLGSMTDAPPILTATLVITAWAAFTRLLHWDGLADTVDGLLGSFERERMLEIMRDSRVGAFGVSALVLCMLLQVGAVTGLISAGSSWPLIAAPVFGRAAVSFACWTLPAARREGLGLTIVGPGTPWARMVAFFTLACVGALPFLESLVKGSETCCSASTASILLLGALALLVVPRALARPVGGMTGDLFGASVILVETAVLVAAALVL